MDAKKYPGAAGKVVTFYSYKGGVGRSMAMANIAVLLAEWGYRTLVVDWDLEAPGLENFYKDFLNIDEVIQRNGLIDLLALNNSEAGVDVTQIDWDAYINTIDINGVPLYFLSAGRRDDHYIAKVRKFDYGIFYSEFDGGQFIEDIRDQWREAYDFILIDSRTGLTDSSGVCTIQMPDILVLLFTPNVQSFNGIKNVSKRAMDGQKKLVYDRFRLRTLQIPSRIENAETTLLDYWLQKIASESEPMFEWLPRQPDDLSTYVITPLQVVNQVKIPYRTFYAYEERLAVVDRGKSDPQDLGYVYETIAATIANDLGSIHLLVDSRDLFVKKARGIEIVDPAEAEKLREEKERIEGELRKKEASEQLSQERVSQLEEDLATSRFTIEQSKRRKRYYSIYFFIFIFALALAVAWWAKKSADNRGNERQKFMVFQSVTDSVTQSHAPGIGVIEAYYHYYGLSGEYRDSAVSYKTKIDSIMFFVLKSKVFNLYYATDPAEVVVIPYEQAHMFADTVKQYGTIRNVPAATIYAICDSIQKGTRPVIRNMVTERDRYRYIDAMILYSSPYGFTLNVKENIFSVVQKKPATLEYEFNNILQVVGIKVIDDGGVSSEDSSDILKANSRILESQVKNNAEAADVKVAPSLEKVAKVLNEEAPDADNFWVYLGRLENGEWSQKTFRFKKLPEAKEVITSQVSVYKRLTVPAYINREWVFGKITGVVSPGTSVSVVRTARIASAYNWALVAPIRNTKQ